MSSRPRNAVIAPVGSLSAASATGSPYLSDEPLEPTAHLPAAGHGKRQTQRADPPAPRRALRDLRVDGVPTGSPHPRTCRSQSTGPSKETLLDALHCHAAAQNAGHLPSLPRGHPHRARHEALPEMITGERGARKLHAPFGKRTTERTYTIGTSPAPHITRGAGRGNGPAETLDTAPLRSHSTTPSVTACRTPSPCSTHSMWSGSAPRQLMGCSARVDHLTSVSGPRSLHASMSATPQMR